MPEAPRLARTTDAWAPIYVVWELTLRCDLACRHCGSRAGLPRAQELSLEEAAGVVDQLATLGTREIAFIGGEAYLHPDWLKIVRLAADAGIRPTMTSGARAFDAATAQAAAQAGLQAVSVSVDGLEATHDLLRAVPGSHRAALAALRHIAAAGMEPFANTQWNKLNLPEVEALGAQLLDHGIRAWQVQITGPMGRAADRPEWLLQPYDMLELMPRLAAVALEARDRGCRLHPGNNLGYYGPYEDLLRNRAIWQGCVAGRYVMGIESNGDIKGCPSLPSGPYVGGNLRDRSVAEIWAEAQELAYTRTPRAHELWGYCGRCYYKEVCQGGCAWTSHTTLGRRGNMPWCHHRALELEREGIRERLIRVEAPPGTPFDFGLFELVEEPFAP